MIIEEGGNAVNGRRIQQEEVPIIMNKVDEFLGNLGLVRGDDYDIVGSAGKKRPGETSGDIDVCIKRDKLVSALGTDDSNKKQVFNDLSDYLKEQGIELSVAQPGFSQVSFALPINGPEDVVQVDFMVVRNMEWSKFMQASPDYRKDESKYKGHVRNVLMMCIVKNCFSRTIKRVTLEDDTIRDGEIEAYVIRLTDGLYKTRKNWFGKKGDTLVKTDNLMHEYDELITDTPQGFIDLLFDDATVDNFLSFETVYELLMSDKFKYPENREKILITFVMSLDGQGIEIPSEVDNDIVTKAKEKEEYLKNKELEPRKKLKIKSIENLEEKRYIKTFSEFVNEKWGK